MSGMSDRETARKVDVVCPACGGRGGDWWREADGSENGQRCGVCAGFGHVDAELRSTPDAPVCEWREIGDFFTSGCDVNTDVCTDDPSFWSGWDFCPYCGQPLELAPSQETPA